MLEDITPSPAVQAKQHGMLATMEQADDLDVHQHACNSGDMFEVDRGQESYRASKRIRKHSSLMQQRGDARWLCAATQGQRCWWSRFRWRNLKTW